MTYVLEVRATRVYKECKKKKKKHKCEEAKIDEKEIRVEDS